MTMEGHRLRRENLLMRYYTFLSHIFPSDQSVENFNRISMAEGNTPLVEAGPHTLEFLASRGMEKASVSVYFKQEWRNPTGSFKDRGMVVAVAKAKEEGAVALLCASTGNTSASAAAYGSRAGLTVYVIIPEGVPDTKVLQAAAYGAKIVKQGRNFDEAQAAAIELAGQFPGVRLVNSINPHRLEGQKTAAFEISEALGDAPDYLAIPVGNAGNITAYWKGFNEYFQAGLNKTLPVLIGARAAKGTAAQAIAIDEPVNKEAAYQAASESGGVILEDVPDNEMLAAHESLRHDGQLTELASAISLAALPRHAAQHRIPEGSRLVLVLTGNGLKDIDISLGSRGSKNSYINLEDLLLALRK